jgi:hypothetical protein
VWVFLTTHIYSLYTQTLLYPMFFLLQTEAENIGTDLFDPATSKLGGVAILTIHLGIMAQLKKFFLIATRRRFFDFLNYPVAFALVTPILPPWPIWEYGAWANYVGGSVALAVLASVTAQKVRDAVPEEDKQEAALHDARKAEAETKARAEAVVEEGGKSNGEENG